MKKVNKHFVGGIFTLLLELVPNKSGIGAESLPLGLILY